MIDLDHLTFVIAVVGFAALVAVRAHDWIRRRKKTGVSS